MHIRLMQLDEAPSVASFIARLQPDPTHQIAYFDMSPEDIVEQLRGFDTHPACATLLAYEKERFLGLLGLEVSAEIQRTWLYGPLISEGEDWAVIADALYARALESFIPPGYSQELFVDVQHTRMADFAARHGFPARPLESSMRLDRPHAAQLPTPQAVYVLDPPYTEGFVALHDRLFPGTYYSGQQILARLGERDRVYITRDEGNAVNGYIYAKVEDGPDSAYIDFLGVAEQARRKGLGSALTCAAVGWLLTFSHVNTIALTVRGTNTPAVALYQRLGFVLTQTLAGYRKVAPSSVTA